MLLSRKLGVSMMIGYVLLVTFAIIMGAVVYTWMKSYVPTETLECPDGVSIFMREISCDSIGGEEYNLTIDIVNNGRFAVDGYYIKYTNNPEQKIGILPLTDVIYGGQAAQGIMFFSGQVLEPGINNPTRFKLSEKAYLIEITPIRYEVIEGKNRMAICGDARVRESINCG